MLPIKEQDGKSDTRIFAETLFPSWGGVGTLSSKKFRKKLSKFATGSKLVFLTTNSNVLPDGYTIINEKDGHWDKGVWWSNSSYKWKRYSYAGAGGSTSSFTSSGWSPTTPTDLYAYSNTRVSSRVLDCTYYDPKLDEYVWGELWTCDTCGGQEYIDEDNINDLDFCPTCDTCWFCSLQYNYCTCYYQSLESKLPKRDDDSGILQPTLWGYDKSINQGSMY
jgi:hypothetical protein